MTLKTFAILAGALIGLAAVPALAQNSKDWVDIKSAKELRALYSNKTFKGKDYLDRPWMGHYRADGQGIMISEAGRIPRSWEVKGDDQVCVKSSSSTPCFRFQRHKTKAGIYRVINVANDQITEVSVEDGIPKF